MIVYNNGIMVVAVADIVVESCNGGSSAPAKVPAVVDRSGITISFLLELCRTSLETTLGFPATTLRMRQPS